MQVNQGKRTLTRTPWWKKPAVIDGGIATAVVLVVVMFSVLLSGSSAAEQAPSVVTVKSSAVLELPTETSPRLVLDGTEERLVAGVFVTTWPDWEADSPHAPEGFLLKVKHSTIADGVTTVDVEPASLFEAEPEGGLSTDDSRFSSVALSSIEEPTPSVGEVDAEEAVLARASLTAASEAPDPVGELKQPLTKTFGCGGSGDIGLEGKVDTSLEPNVRLVWSKRGRLPVGVDYAAVWVNGKAKVRLTARATGALRCEPDPILLVEPSWRTVVVVGQVPVPITVSLPVELAAWAQGQADALITATLESEATLGVSHRAGHTERMAEFSAPEFHLDSEWPEVTGSAEASVFPAVKVEAGWRVRGLGKLAATAKLGARGGVHVGFAAAEEPPVRACIPVTVEASLVVHLVRKSLGPWTVTPYQANLRCNPPDPDSESREETG